MKVKSNVKLSSANTHIHMSSTPSRPKVVIVGGSFSGLCAMRHLYKHADVTIVEAKDYFEYYPGILHLLTGSNAYDTILTDLSHITNIANTRHIRGIFMGLKGNEEYANSSGSGANMKTAIVAVNNAITNGDEIVELAYDAIIICTGAPYTSPIRPTLKVTSAFSPSASSKGSRIKQIQATISEYASCKDIVVIGGGLIGVELIAEINHRLNSRKEGKRLHLVTRSSLLPTLPKRAGEYALHYLRKHNIQVYLDDEIVHTNVADNCITLKTGKKVVYDKIIDCTGAKKQEIVNNDNNNKSSSDIIWPYTNNNNILVDEHLQSVSYPQLGLFASGDVLEHSPGVSFACSSVGLGPMGTKSRLPGVRNAHLGESQAELCSTNVLRYIENVNRRNSNAKAVEYLSYPQHVFGIPANPLLSCVSLGPNNAIVVFNDLVICGLLFGFIGGFVKLLIERSKISEVRNEVWGRLFWSFGHVASNSISKFGYMCSMFISKLYRNAAPRGGTTTTSKIIKAA